MNAGGNDGPLMILAIFALLFGFSRLVFYGYVEKNFWKIDDVKIAVMKVRLSTHRHL